MNESHLTEQLPAEKATKTSRLKALLPFVFIIIISLFVFHLRYFDELNLYDLHLTYALPVAAIFYLSIVYYFFIINEGADLKALGLAPNKVKLTVSLIFGVVSGIFFFMVYFGAHPNRQFPNLITFVYFNLYFIFVAFADELFFRAWAIHNFQKSFTRGRSFVLSAIGYTIASLSVIGKDLSSVVAGRIDIFIILESIFRSFMIGLLLAAIFSFTRSIYGNIVFILISTIPILYEEDGPVFKGNPVSALIALFGFCFFVLLLVFRYRKMKKKDTPPVPDH